MSTPSSTLPSVDPDQPSWTHTLRDGSTVLIRPINTLDKDLERAFIVGLNQQTRRYRFMGSIGEPSERMVKELTDVDQIHRVAFVAIAQEGGQERIVGVVRYGTATDSDECESAVTVEEDWQNRGLGTTLMNHLIGIARTRGIRRMYSVDSAENDNMHGLAQHLGFHTTPDPSDSTQVVHTLDV